MVVELDDIRRTYQIYQRYLKAMEKLGPEETYKLDTMAPVAEILLDLTGKLLTQKKIAKELGLNPGRRGAPREALPWYNPEWWEIDYTLNDERRTFRGTGDLSRLIAMLQDYALYAAKKIEVTSTKRIR